MQADTIVYGRIFTADPQRPWAEAAAIADGRFIAVGDADEVCPLAGSKTEVLDAGSGLVTPGMCDAHMHLSQGAIASYYQADLSGASSCAEIVERLRAFIEAHPGRAVYQGYGWSDAVFEAEGIAPDRTFLDAVCAAVPLFIRSYDGHSLAANTACLKLAGIGAGYVSSQTGQIILDADGVPTGLFREWTMRDIMEAVPPFTEEDYRAAIKREQMKFVRVGVTNAFEPIIDNGPTVRAAYRALDDADELLLKMSSAVYVRPEAEDVAAVLDAFETEPLVRPDGHFSCRCAKVLIDGVVEGQTAFLDEDYAHRPGYRGLPICTSRQYRAALREIAARDLQLHVHAIGDAAVAMALDGIEEMRPYLTHRVAITHLQLVRPQDIARMARLGCIACANPIWHEKEPGYYAQLALPYLGFERAERQYPLEDLFRAGITVSMGTDYPVSDPDPLLGIEVGVTRSMPGDATGETCLGLDQRARVSQMLCAATVNGAYQNGAEDRFGTIAVGKEADLALFDRDITRVEASAIHEARCLVTLIDGRVVWSDPAL